MTPKIRFQGFPKWTDVPFSNAFSLLKNNTLSRADLNYENGAVKNVHYGDVLIKFGSILDVKKEELPFITDIDAEKKFGFYALNNGDIIMADTAEDDTVGKSSEIVGITDEIVVAGLHTIPFRPLSGLFEVGYLGHYINSSAFHDQLRPLMQGIKVTSISKSALQESTTISVPSLEEQRMIADLFASYDEKISLQQQKVEALERRKKGLLQKVFSQEIRFKADDGSEFPEWEEKSLGEIGYASGGYVFPNVAQGHLEYDIPFYKVSDMNLLGNEVQMNVSNNTVSEELAKAISAKPFRRNAIIFAKVGAALLLDRKRIAVAPFLVDNNMMVFTPNEEIDINWLLYWFYTFKLASLSQVGAVPSFGSSALRKVTIPIPYKSEQQKIADFFSAIDKQIEIETKRLESMQTIKKGLLQQMFC